MRKSIRRISRRKKSVSDKYSRKSRITKTARNKNRSRNHKKSRKQMYEGGGCGASSAAGVRPKEVTDWWYQSEERNGDGYYTWTQMRPNETKTMNVQYEKYCNIRNEQIIKEYSFELKMNDSSHGETGVHGDDVHIIYFYDMEMTHTRTRFTRKIISTTRCEGVPPVLPTGIKTAPFIKPVIPSKDAFYVDGHSQLDAIENKWYWESDDGSVYNEFDRVDDIFLKSEYDKYQKDPQQHVVIYRKKPWKFNFQNMTQTNTTTKSTRRIYYGSAPPTGSAPAPAPAAPPPAPAAAAAAAAAPAPPEYWKVMGNISEYPLYNPTKHGPSNQ